MKKTTCFTGRRPKDLCGYSTEAYGRFVSELAGWLVNFTDPAARNETEFISGGAQGFDQLAFWAVDLMKANMPEPHRALVKNTVYVPFRGQQRIWKDTGLFSKTEYDAMLRCADRVAYLKDELNARGEIVSALMNRNHMMVDASDGVVALYPDDTWEQSSGGTAECMRYAASKGKTVIQLPYVIQGRTLVGQFPVPTGGRESARELPAFTAAAPGPDMSLR